MVVKEFVLCVALGVVLSAAFEGQFRQYFVIAVYNEITAFVLHFTYYKVACGSGIADKTHYIIVKKTEGNQRSRSAFDYTLKVPARIKFDLSVAI